MTIDTINNSGAVNMKLCGRLDSTTAGELEEALKTVFSGEVASLSLDLADVDYISSKGLRVIVTAYQQLAGKEMTLLSPNASILEVLRMSGLLKLFTVR